MLGKQSCTQPSWTGQHSCWSHTTCNSLARRLLHCSDQRKCCVTPGALVAAGQGAAADGATGRVLRTGCAQDLCGVLGSGQRPPSG